MPSDLRFEDIPTIAEARRRGRRPTVQARAAAAAYRLAERRWGSGTARGGAVSGTLAITAGLLQLVPTRLLWWGVGPYSTHAGCSDFTYEGPCDSPCFGFAPHHMDAFYCATCAEEANVPGNFGYWHFVGSRWTIQYMDREPDVCLGRDAWKWSVKEPCGRCASSATFRCHDGWKRYPGAASWDPTICEGLVLCDGALVRC